MATGVIGGSGVYDIDGVDGLEELTVETPFGSPSDSFMRGRIGGAEVVFLPRHGRGHVLTPTELNHRANIYAMKTLGVDTILSISAVGSFKEALKPGDIVLIDQFVDRTKRPHDHTFFGGGIVGHVSFSHPTCSRLADHVEAAIRSELAAANPNGVSVHRGGTYLNMEGPAFSTLAESLLYKSWGMDVIGMTNMAEAKLAREAEICYQTLAMVTDYDCWHETHGAVSVEMIIATLMQNAELGQRIVKRAVPSLPDGAACSCRSALQSALVTRPDLVSAETRRRLAPIIGKYLPV